MNAHTELIGRVAERRRQQLGTLSDAAFQELREAVEADVQHFVDCAQDEAFMLVDQAIQRHNAACVGEDLLDDDEFFASRRRRMARLVRDCDEALGVDPSCLDALLLRTLALDQDPDQTLDPLLELTRRAEELTSQLDLTDDAWNNLLARPLLRIKAAVARTCLDSARYRMAAQACEEGMTLSPTDALGMRHTAALAYARLEDEQAFDALDVRFMRAGSAWSHLAHTILLYKLGRMAAARRSLGGYARLCEGGAYALIKPVMVDTYLPDRPEAAPLSFGEATLAVHEADPVICDVPDFVGWAQSQRDVWFSAQDFARRRDLDW